MNADDTMQDDLATWSQLWQTGAQGNAGDLYRQMRAKRRRMQWTLGMQVLLTLATTAQIGRLFVGQFDGYWLAWGAGMLLLVWSLQFAVLYLQRGLWRQQGLQVVALLKLARRRAQYALQHVSINLAGTVFVALTLVPLTRHEWAQRAGNPTGRTRLLIMGAVIAALTAGTVFWAFWQRRRQLQRIRELDALLREYD